jgi:hypothetical protein
MTVVLRNLYEPIFKKGDIVYFDPEDEVSPSGVKIIGLDKDWMTMPRSEINKPLATVKKDTPYEVMECRPKSQAHLGLSILLPDGRRPFFDPYDFISENEYRRSKGLSLKPTHNFKSGEVVYYDGIEHDFDYHNSYSLWTCAKDKDRLELWHKDRFIPLLKTYINANFISKEEYNKKYGVEEPKKAIFNEPDTRKIANYTTFAKAFKAGDKIYYLGDKIQKLKSDTPYKVDFYNPNTGMLKIGDVVCPDEDFISKDEYEKMNDYKDINKKGQEKSEIQLKYQIYKDTKSRKIKWTSPYSEQPDWYRSIIKLEEPKSAYLRIDVRKMKDEWELVIYYHKDRPPFTAENNGMVLKHFKETAALKAVAQKIKDSIEADQDDIYDKIKQEVGALRKKAKES